MAQVDFEHQDKFSALMKGHFNNPEYCGVRIIADDGTEFYCAEYALRCGSEVFHKMLSHDMREKISGEVHIGDAASDIIQIMLCFMHSGKCSLDSTNLLPVMRIALRYQVHLLVSVCEEYQNKHFSVDETNCFCILNQIYMFPEMPQALRQRCQHVILQRLAMDHGDLTVQEGFLDLSYLIIEDISKTAVSHMFLHQPFPAGYVNFALALLRWLDHDQTRRRSDALSLLSSLEFKALGLEGLAKITTREFPQTNWVREHPALEQNILNALSYVNRNPINYAASTTLTFQPGRWTFVCKSGSSTRMHGCIAVMATFDLEETTQISATISQSNGSSGCVLSTVCSKNCTHVLIAAGGVRKLPQAHGIHASNADGCCSFSHDGEVEWNLPHIVATYRGRAAVGYNQSSQYQENNCSYVHPLAVDHGKRLIASNHSSASALARPTISTTK